MIVAGAVVVLLMLGGAVAVSFFRSPTPAAAKGLPSTVAMAVEINFSPSPADQLALSRIVNKLPLGEEMPETTDYKEALWELIPDDGDKPDYATEIKPWLGNSLAVGFLSPDLGAPSWFDDQAVMAIETTDTRKAEEFASGSGWDGEYFFVDEVLVLAPAATGLDAEMVKADALADDAAYRADMARLGGGNLGTVWLGPGLFDLILEDADTMALPGADLDAIRGSHGAAGLKVAENRIMVETQFISPNYPQPEVDDVRSFAEDLPGAALVAVAGSGSTQAYEQSWEALEQAGLGGQLEAFGITSAADMEALLGRQIGLTLALADSGEPVVAAKFVSDDPARQRALMDTVVDSLYGEDWITAEQHGDTMYVVAGQPLEAALNPSSLLGDSAAYKDVVTGPAGGLGFVDVEAFKGTTLYQELAADPYSSEFAAWLAPVRSIGMTGTAGDDGYSEGQLQVRFN
ncbi:hypothetical protein GCM10025789_16370 [Tessaracoccus lubricantis]|uniref:DUF3352 domain-containing protein n=1 Tax=Tessaracoccus lubricantis TaxID=545543 RepID=A0ABP9FCK8_9ACTN